MLSLKNLLKMAVRLIHDTQCRKYAIARKFEFMVQNISECCKISFIATISALSVWSQGKEEACFTKINITPNS